MSGSFREALDRLCEVEEKRDLLHRKVGGWSAWPLIRFEVSLLLSGISFPHRRPVSRLNRGILALRDLPSLVFVRHARHLIKTYTSGLAEKSGGRFRDVWFDDVLLAAGSVFKIEVANTPDSAARSRHALIERTLSSATVDLISSLLSRHSPGTDVMSVARVFGRALREDLSLPDLDDVWVARRLYRFMAAKTIYGSIIRRVGPAFVLVADPGEHALVAAAKEQEIPALELQHGIADSSNASYMWPASAKPHRRTMPVPDRLLLYGKHWRDDLDRQGFWGDSLRVVGSPRLDRYRAGVSRVAGGACTILFTTQGLDVDAVTTFLRHALQQLVPDVAFRMFVKLHPIHDADRRPYVAGLAPLADRVEVLAAEEGPATFELLQRAHLHVSIASASHYDAIGLGVPTVILPFRTHEIVLPMVRAGHAHLARTPDELAAVVRRWRNLTVPVEVSDYYFEPGALPNILRELALDPHMMEH